MLLPFRVSKNTLSRRPWHEHLRRTWLGMSLPSNMLTTCINLDLDFSLWVAEYKLQPLLVVSSCRPWKSCIQQSFSRPVINSKPRAPRRKLSMQLKKLCLFNTSLQSDEDAMIWILYCRNSGLKIISLAARGERPSVVVRRAYNDDDSVTILL